MTDQPELFDTNPLFELRQERAHAEPFKPTDYAHQEILGTCPVCLDTGRVEGKYCTCDAGTNAWYQDHQGVKE